MVADAPVTAAGPLDGKLAFLGASIRAKGSIVIGLSAGVDSALLAKVSRMELGDRAVAVTAVSPSLSSRDRELAERNAREIGIRHVTVSTDEMANESYRANGAMRCFHCKTELSRELWRFAASEGISSVALGINASDSGDFRPGIRAAEESGICFPLKEAGMSKEEIREAARRFGLSAHDRPSNSCLSSRVQYGQPIDSELLRRVELAEEVVRAAGASDVRVRVHGQIARIEVDAGSLKGLVDEKTRKGVLEGLRALGFTYVTLDLAGLVSGSMNLSLRNSR